KDPIEWDGQYRKAAFYKTLLQLKSTHPALRGGDSSVTTFRLHNSSPGELLAYVRQQGEKKVLVLLNMSTKPIQFRIDDEAATDSWTNVFDNTTISIASDKEISLS